MFAKNILKTDLFEIKLLLIIKFLFFIYIFNLRRTTQQKEKEKGKSSGLTRLFAEQSKPRWEKDSLRL